MLLGLLMYAPIKQIDDAFLTSPEENAYFLDYSLFKQGLNQYPDLQHAMLYEKEYYSVKVAEGN